MKPFRPSDFWLWIAIVVLVVVMACLAYWSGLRLFHITAHNEAIDPVSSSAHARLIGANGEPRTRHIHRARGVV